ncbi:MAG TPA: hypothetical protein VMR33_15355 [Candidatus Baltobacteraceae bacterium]|nr:hypothetical protein [Candidatus Baltobacteraceae bacterium]
MRQLEFFQRRVRQGVQVEDCQAFARFITNSGICTLMEDQPCQGENERHTARLKELFPYDGKQLHYEARQLEMACCEYWVGRTRDSEGTAKGASLGDLESIERKLDLMAGRLASLESVKPVAKRRVKLRIIDKKENAA